MQRASGADVDARGQQEPEGLGIPLRAAAQASSTRAAARTPLLKASSEISLERRRRPQFAAEVDRDPQRRRRVAALAAELPADAYVSTNQSVVASRRGLARMAT